MATGGAGELGNQDSLSRGFTGLPPHTLLVVKATMLAIDDW